MVRLTIDDVVLLPRSRDVSVVVPIEIDLDTVICGVVSDATVGSAVVIGLQNPSRSNGSFPHRRELNSDQFTDSGQAFDSVGPSFRKRFVSPIWSIVPWKAVMKSGNSGGEGKT